MKPIEPIDQTQRRDALDPRRSFAVRAPAGSGKTELLTQRVLKLLALVDSPEEVLCITFTRKAAAEMQQRIISALQQGKQSTPPSEAYRQFTWQLARSALNQSESKNWQLLDHPNRLNIKTIDGLSAQLTKQLPLLSQFGSQPKVVDDPTPYYQQASDALLAELENDNSTGKEVAILLRQLDNDISKATELLCQLLSKRDQWLAHIYHGQNIYSTKLEIEEPLLELWQEHVNNVRADLKNQETEICHLLNYAAKNLIEQNIQSPITAAANIQTLPTDAEQDREIWLAIIELLIKKDGDYRKQLNKNVGFKHDGSQSSKAILAEKKAAFAALTEQLNSQAHILLQLNSLRALPPFHYNDEQWQFLQTLTHLLPVLTAHLKVIFHQQGVADFIEINNSALQALGDPENPTDLALTLDHKISHILVDEFQDTSIAQIRLLEALSAGWQNQDGKTLFIVGDGMQSIYGFRNANVGLFLAVRQYGINNLDIIPLDLCVNFRSEQGIIQWINDYFSSAFPPQDDLSRGAVKYTPSIAFKTTSQQKSVYLIGHSGTQAQISEAEKIAEKIKSLRNQCPSESIALLVRSRPHLIETLAQFKQQKIPWQAHEIESIVSDPAVLDLLNLAKALNNLADRTAWLSLLRAPWCGLELNDLLTVTQNSSYSIWYNLNNPQQLELLTPSGQQRVNRIRPILENALAQYLQKNHLLWLEGVWHELGGREILENDTSFENIRGFFQLLEQELESDDILDLEIFEQKLVNLKISSNTEDNHGVQVMTLHKAKGLEFDHVFIPALQKSAAVDDKPILLWQQRLNHLGQDRLYLSPKAATGDEDYPLYQWIRNEQKLESQLENTRLLYVGATRAIKTLHLSACLEQEEKKGELKKPPQASLLNCIWPVFQNQAQIISADLESQAEQSQLFSAQEQRTVKRIPLHFKPAPIIPVEYLNDFTVSDFSFEENNKPKFRPHQTNPIIGTVVHLALQQLSERPLSHWSETEIEKKLTTWLNLFRQYGIYDSENLKQSQRYLRQAVTNIITDTRGRWIIDTEQKEAQSELPLSIKSGDESKRIIIDRTFVCQQNLRWIIDYKTNLSDTRLVHKSVNDPEVNRHRTQLESYAFALAKLDSRPIKTALYYPLSKDWIVLN